MRLLLGTGRKDESGDFTRGAGLELRIKSSASCDFFAAASQDVTLVGNATDSVQSDMGPGEKIHTFQSLDGEMLHHVESNTATIEQLGARFGNELVHQREGIAELEEIRTLVEAAGYGRDRIRIDPSVVRGLEYYTGPVFEAELTFPSTDEDGRLTRFGSVGGGGRYDGLVARFREEPVPATGFSIGVSRLLAALRAIKSPIVAAAETPGPVVVLALDRDADSMANYQRLVACLRRAGIAAELYLGSGGMNAQLKYADRRRSRVAVIQGSNERNAAGGPQVTIRDLKLGAELAKTTKDRADYLELRQRAQFPAPEAELVERVREVLAR